MVSAEASEALKPFLIRAFREEDAPAASEILQESREATAWSAEMTRATFSSGHVSGFIAEVVGKPTGCILGREVWKEGEILNLAVKGNLRGKGQGSALVAAMLSVFSARGVVRVFLEVRESNLGAIAFYKRLGFRQVGRREGYYHEPREAALILQHSTNNLQFSTE
jgi:[ribosomal protein S18]-alanine N-acetyltransferase